MKIAIHAADLDHDRIDGTRVYILNMLKNFGVINKKNPFLIYHQKEFNVKLIPPLFANYFIKKIPFPFFWTQTRFALELLLNPADILWMPVQNVPLIRRKSLKVVVTIHDLAFKIFPEYFTKKDLKKLNMLTDMAINNADRIIAVSDSTKKDIIKFYPQIKNDKIFVIYHGFDSELFQGKTKDDNFIKLSESYNLKAGSYLLYVGAIQPRKNLNVLIDAFEKIKEKNPGFKLVLAGAPAWKHESTFEKISKSNFKEDIIVTGTISFESLSALYRNATVFVFPSLYEGFGIPVLEAMASGVPVICARNSSLLEVAGEAALYFETENSAELAQRIESIANDEKLRSELIQRGLEHSSKFSWEKCAQETLEKLIIW